ncbi:MAG: quinoprotein dehydrogenase-associated SoxYZ-like carrier [Gimesia sp.]
MRSKWFLLQISKPVFIRYWKTVSEFYAKMCYIAIQTGGTDMSVSTIMRMGRRRFSLGLGTTMFLAAGPVSAKSYNQRWAEIKTELFGDRLISDGFGIIDMTAPYRAYDAAVVPLTITAMIPQKADRYVSKIYLVIDENPVPIAAIFDFHDGQNGWATLETRVRVNEYTNVRAIAETNDGKLYMVTKFIKAAGGCSAPAGKDQALALKRLGKMKLKFASPVKFGQPNVAQILISHPNNSGLQFDQVTRSYVTAHYVESIKLTYDGKPILTVTTDISISENPSIHFSFIPKKTGVFKSRVVDTEDQVFEREWKVTSGGVG